MAVLKIRSRGAARDVSALLDVCACVCACVWVVVFVVSISIYVDGCV